MGELNSLSFFKPGDRSDEREVDKDSSNCRDDCSVDGSCRVTGCDTLHDSEKKNQFIRLHMKLVFFLRK